MPSSALREARGRGSVALRGARGQATPGQISAARGAQTEAARNRARLAARGDLDILEEERERDEPSTFSTLTGPVFDILTRSAAATSGAALELTQGSGDVKEAFNEAARQFVKSEDRKFKETPTFSQVLAGGQDVEATAMQAAAGFALDVVLDPINLVPVGAAAKFIGKGGKLVFGALEELPGLGRAATKTKEAVGKAFVPDFDLKNLAKLGDEALAAETDPIEAAKAATEVFTSSSLDDFLRAKMGRNFQDDQLTRGLAATVTRLSDGLTTAEAELLGKYADQGDDALRTMLEIADITGKRNDELVDRGRKFLQLFRVLGKGDVRAGVLDAGRIRSGYVPIRTKGGEEVVRESERRALRGGQQPFQKERRFDKVEEAVAEASKPIETDIRQLARIRSLESVKARGTRSFRNAILDNPSISLRIAPDLMDDVKAFKKGERPSDVLQQYLDNGYDFTEIVKGDDVWYALPTPIVNDLDHASRLFTNNETLNSAIDGFQKWSGVWKGMAVFSPGFHMRNMYSNWFNNWLGGVNNPAVYKEALDRMWAGNAAKFMRTGDETLRNTGDELVQEAMELGVIGRGEISRELGEHAGATGVAGRIIESAPMRANRRVGQTIEDNARFAHYLQKRKDGLEPLAAAQSAKKYLFDYGELTTFERDIMKSIVPFYTWTRKNLPLQIEAMVSNPAKYGRVQKLINNFEQMSADQRDTATPDYFEELHAVRVPKVVQEGLATLNGNPILRPTFLNPNFPFQELNRGNFRDAVSGINPFFKIPIETIQNRSLFLGRDIERFEGEVDEVTGLRRLHQNIIDSLLPPAGKVRRLALEKGRGFLAQQLFSEIIGIKFIGVDEARERRSKLFRERNATRRALDASDRRRR